MSETMRRISKTALVIFIIVCILFVHSCESKRRQRGQKVRKVGQDTNLILRRRNRGQTEDNRKMISTGVLKDAKRPRRRMHRLRDSNIILRRGDPALKEIEDFSSKTVNTVTNENKTSRQTTSKPLPDARIIIGRASPPTYTELDQDDIEDFGDFDEREVILLPDSNKYIRQESDLADEDGLYEERPSIDEGNFIGREVEVKPLPDSNKFIRLIKSDLLAEEDRAYNKVPVFGKGILRKWLDSLDFKDETIGESESGLLQ